jgi:hypothetical protein
MEVENEKFLRLEYKEINLRVYKLIVFYRVKCLL